MFSHMAVGTNDMDRARTFYDALFAAMGGRFGGLDPKGRLAYFHKGALLIVGHPIDGEAATPGNGATIGFAMDGTEQVDTWHKVGVENGGTSIEDAPGLRMSGQGPLYLAYLRDPDGNKLCAVHRPAA